MAHAAGHAAHITGYPCHQGGRETGVQVEGQGMVSRVRSSLELGNVMLNSS